MVVLARRPVWWFARCVASCTAAASVAAIVVVVVIDARFTHAGRSDLRMFTTSAAPFVAALISATVVGGVLLVRRPEHPVGWCFATLALGLDVAAVGESYGIYGIEVRPGGAAGAGVAAVVSDSVFVIWLIALSLSLSLTPDGRHVSRRWQVASGAMVISGVSWMALRLVRAGPLEVPFDEFQNPWAVSALDLTWLRLILAVVFNGLIVVSAIFLVVRFLRSRGHERDPLRWMAVIAVPFAALVIVSVTAALLQYDSLLTSATAGFVALPPVGALLAITRYRLYDIDRIVSRAVGYLVVSVLMAAIYAVVVVAAARAIGETTSRAPVAIALATLAAASAVRPVHAAVQDLVDRRFARRRYDAIGRMRAFVAEPTSSATVETAFRAALGDSTVRVAYPLRRSDQWVTEDGLVAAPDETWLEVPRAGRTIAAISHSSEPSLVAEVIRVAAPELDNAGLRAAIAVQLQEVRASRRRILRAQLDERQRIERDLHDGAQQRLLGMAAQLQAAALNGDPERMRSTLDFGVDQCREAVVELRSLANGLHPAALVDGGLAAALEELCSRSAPTTVVEVPDRRYPPDVEATLWFVTCEALANAAKHADASATRVHLAEADGVLRLTVDDDGCGGADAAGDGLRGLADRVAAVGGGLVVAGRDGGGTRVEAVVPCAW